MLLVISPSKTQDFTGPGPAEFSRPVFLAEIDRLVGILKRFEKKELAELMNLSEKLAGLNWQRFQDFSRTFERKNSRQAILAFRGDVYAGIRADELSAADLDFAQDHLRIISGLYGLLKPLDLIQPYRLEMKTKLRSGAAANLYDFWDNRITEALNDAMAGNDGWLVNLASQEYFKAVRPEFLSGQVLDIVFKVRTKGQYKVIAIHAKRARGLMVRFVIKNRLENAEELKEFNEEGYRYVDSLSHKSQWVFCRE